MNAKVFLSRTYNSVVNPIQFWIEKQSEVNPGGLGSFLSCLSIWWNHRPKKEPCQNCKEPVWTNRWADVFCGQDCYEAYYDDNIPF